MHCVAIRTQGIFCVCVRVCARSLYVAIPCSIIFFVFCAFILLIIIDMMIERQKVDGRGGGSGWRGKDTSRILYMNTSLLSFSITDFGRCVHVKYLRMGPFKRGVYTYRCEYAVCCMVRGGCWMNIEHIKFCTLTMYATI